MAPARQFRLRLVTPVDESAPPNSPPAPDDRALLAGLTRRDAAACAAFYDRARPILDRTLPRLLGPRDHEYEDIAQAALFELVRSARSFRHECPLDAWLSIVTARVAYRWIRRRRLERRFFAQPAPNASIPESTVAPVAFASRQAIERIRAHLSRMDQKRSWTFLLHDVHGYDLRQVGEIMNTSVSAAQSRLVRGRRELHELIRDDPELAHFLDDLSEEVP